MHADSWLATKEVWMVWPSINGRDDKRCDLQVPKFETWWIGAKKSVDSEHGSEAKFTPYQIIFITFTYRNKIIYMVTDRIMEKKKRST